MSRPVNTPASAPFRLRYLSLGAAALVVGVAVVAMQSTAQEARTIPPPAVDKAGEGTSEVAVLAGGCFWGVQGVFQHLKGVTNAVSGYAGGDKSTANYRAVTTGRTGHAESVQVTFDPRQITYGRILQVFYSVAHDPTQLNRQGPDVGTQYRSAVFPEGAEQERIGKAYVAQLDQAKVFHAAIVTKSETGAFYAAEDYHQDFLTRNPTHPYIVVHDLPKLRDLKRLFPDLYRTEPVLVAGARPSN